MTSKASIEWSESWRILGDHGLRSGRYTDPAFAQLEFQRLWYRVWQAAARLDEIPEPGDFTTYDIGDQSVMLVRVDNDTVKAYHNACPHRGTALSEGCGSFANQKIICPFHGWRWGLKGDIEYVLERDEFRGGNLCDSDVALREVASAVFAGFVFINLDLHAEPFDDFIAPVRQLLDDMAIEHMHHYWWKAIPAPANWKAAQEAFLEAYHVPATHPQLEAEAARVIYEQRPEGEVAFRHIDITYERFDNGHGRFYGGKNTPMAGRVDDSGEDPVDAMAARLSLLVEGMDAMVLAGDVELVRSLKGKPIPEGSNLGNEYVKALYAQAEEQQRPMPKLTPEMLGMWGGEVFVFPNLMILPQAGNAMIYRVRPDALDPNRCTFEIMSTTTLPAGVKPTRPVLQQVTDLSDPNQVGLIPRQDLGNLARVQKGLHSMGCPQVWLASYQEQLIMQVHQEVDRYLGAPQ